MKWQCTLLQRWLPDYPDGDLSVFWRGRLKAHLEHCPACRDEVAALREAAAAVQAAPAADPGPEFWNEFSREMHLKLVRAAHEGKMAPPPRSVWWSRLPYLVGIPALAGLLLWVAVGYFTPGGPGLTPSQVAQKQTQTPEKVAAAPPAQGFKNPQEPAQTFDYVSNSAAKHNNGEELGAENDLDDLDSTLAGMTDQEKQAFLEKLRQQGKEGSCLRNCSPVFWA
jgi:Putative zinc-finger